MLVDRSSDDLSMLPSSVLDLRLFIHIFVLFVQLLHETSSGSSGDVGANASPVTAFLLHPMNRIGDVEGFLQRTDTGRSSLTVGGTHRCEQWRIDRDVRGSGRGMRFAGGGGSRCRLLVTPRVRQEFVNRVSLVGVNAKQVGDEVLGCTNDTRGQQQ